MSTYSSSGVFSHPFAQHADARFTRITEKAPPNQAFALCIKDEHFCSIYEHFEFSDAVLRDPSWPLPVSGGEA